MFCFTPRSGIFHTLSFSFVSDCLSNLVIGMIYGIVSLIVSSGFRFPSERLIFFYISMYHHWQIRFRVIPMRHDEIDISSFFTDFFGFPFHNSCFCLEILDFQNFTGLGSVKWSFLEPRASSKSFPPPALHPLSACFCNPPNSWLSEPTN